MNAGRHLLLGVFVVGVLGILTFLTFRLSGLSFEERNLWTAHFDRVEGVSEGTHVLLDGLKVGTVARVVRVPDEELAPGKRVRVDFHLAADLKLWREAQVSVRTRGFLGRRELELHRGDRGRGAIDPSTVLLGKVQPDTVDQLGGLIDESRADVKNLLSSLARIVESIEKGEGNVGRLLKGEELYNQLTASATSLRRSADALEKKSGVLGALIHDEALLEEVRATLRSYRQVADRIGGAETSILNDVQAAAREIRKLTEQANNERGPLGRLLYDEDLAKRIENSVRNLERLTVSLNNEEGTVGKLLGDPDLYDRIVGITVRLDEIVAGVQRGEGTIGRLLKDDRVVRELEAMLQAFRETGEVARENAPLSSLTSFTSLFFSILN